MLRTVVAAAWVVWAAACTKRRSPLAQLFRRVTKGVPDNPGRLFFVIVVPRLSRDGIHWNHRYHAAFRAEEFVRQTEQ